MNKLHRKVLLLHTVLTFLYYGCNKEEKVNIIDVEPYVKNTKKEVLLSNYFSRIENIPLETDTTCFVKSIDRLKFVDNYFYIMDRDMVKLYQFTSEGKFVREIGTKGKGPGEFIDIDDFEVNSKEQLVFILSNNSGKLIKYNTKGDFIKEYTLGHYPHRVCLSHDSTGLYLLSPSVAVVKELKKHFRHWSNDGKELRSFLNANIKESTLRSMRIMLNQLYYHNGILYYYDEFYHRLTSIDRNLGEEYIDFCIGGTKFDSNNLGQVESRAQTGTVDTVIKFGDNLFIETLKDMYMGAIIYNTKTKEGFNVVFDYASIDHALYNDLDGGYPVWPRGILNDSTMFSTFSALSYKLDCENSEYLINQKAMDIDNRLAFDRMIDTLGLMSNPVIQILYK